MLDLYGRKIEYLRISVTQDCNLNCMYCMPKDSNPRYCIESLTASEIGKIVSAMANLGIKKVRITGGEPLLRNDICDIITAVAAIDSIEDISLTTNAVLLGDLAKDLKVAGLNRVNISIDSLNEEKFKLISQGGNLKDTLKGLESAIRYDIKPIHINTVLIKGINNEEIDDFILLAKDNPIDVRFIELMPIGKFGEENLKKIVLNSEIIATRPQLIPCKTSGNGQPAIYYQIDKYKGRIGFISPISHKFCGTCNRIRLTCDGKIRPCLGQNGEVSILKTLRENKKNLEHEIERIIYNKPKFHNFEDNFTSVRSMNMIGG
jgi:cyclic pyranopterin phosphate synthase